MNNLFNIYTRAEAEKGILKRVAIDEFDITDGLKQSIEAMFGEPLTPEQVVRRIIQAVRDQGDIALREYTHKIDRVRLDDIQINPEDIQFSLDELDADVFSALKLAARRIEDFHRKQPVTSWIDASAEGTLGQLVRPIKRVGIYVPGGTAPLPSSLLMAAIPAKVAGVEDIIVCTPPTEHGIPQVVLAAAYIAGVENVYQLGGAQAIAAMAYGTDTVPQVDKIVGPGNLFVTLAKREVFGIVGIDGLYGPTETMVIADEFANPQLIAADMLAQAEHDVLSSAILVTPDQDLAQAVGVEIGVQLEQLSRDAIIAESLRNKGGAVIVGSLEEAFDVANEYAVEHLQLSVENPSDWLGYIQNAGAVFLGEHSFEVLGDYVAGPSHSLPTSGTARFASGINVLDFVKLTAIIGLNAATASELSKPAQTIALSESLTAHAAAAKARQ